MPSSAWLPNLGSCHTDRSLVDLLLTEEVELVGWDEDGRGGRRYGGGVTSRLPLSLAAAGSP